MIRVATPADLDAVRYVGFSTWPPTYGPFAGAAFVVRGLDTYWNAETVAHAIAAGDVLVAVDGAGEVVGMSEGGVDGADLVLWKLYVVPEAQHGGVGSALLAAVRDRAHAEGRGLCTEYIAGNDRAGAFYRAHGFRDVGEPAALPSEAVWLRLGA